MTESVLRVLIADDHPIVRDGIRLVLSRRDDLDVVAEAANGREAVQRALHLKPHVAIVDLDMPELSGTAAIKELTRALPDCKCVVLTMHEDDEHVFEALAAGAVGFIVKGASADDIERAVRAAASGQMVLAPEITTRVTQAMTAGRPAKGRTAFPQLTARELDILDHIAQGLDNAAIARELRLAPKTVRNQVSLLLIKLNVPDRASAITAARQAGLGTPKPPAHPRS
jgi:DNA-binding NarL/FixJ family response regulator